MVRDEPNRTAFGKIMVYAHLIRLERLALSDQLDPAKIARLRRPLLSVSARIDAITLKSQSRSSWYMHARQTCDLVQILSRCASHGDPA